MNNIHNDSSDQAMLSGAMPPRKHRLMKDSKKKEIKHLNSKGKEFFPKLTGDIPESKFNEGSFPSKTFYQGGRGYRKDRLSIRELSIQNGSQLREGSAMIGLSALNFCSETID